MVVIYVSVAVVALAFLLLVIYMIGTLKSATKTLNNVANTMSSLEKQLQGVTRETEELLHKTNELAQDINNKSQSLNTMFASVKELGESLGTVNKSLKNVSVKVATEAERQSDKVTQAVQWGNVAIDLYTKWKLKKKTVDNTKEEI